MNFFTSFSGPLVFDRIQRSQEPQRIAPSTSHCSAYEIPRHQQLLIQWHSDGYEKQETISQRHAMSSTVAKLRHLFGRSQSAQSSYTKPQEADTISSVETCFGPLVTETATGWRVGYEAGTWFSRLLRHQRMLVYPTHQKFVDHIFLSIMKDLLAEQPRAWGMQTPGLYHQLQTLLERISSRNALAEQTMLDKYFFWETAGPLKLITTYNEMNSCPDWLERAMSCFCVIAFTGPRSSGKVFAEINRDELEQAIFNARKLIRVLHEDRAKTRIPPGWPDSSGATKKLYFMCYTMMRILEEKKSLLKNQEKVYMQSWGHSVAPCTPSSMP